MQRIERFLGKPKTVKIGGEDVELKPLTVRNIDILTKLGNDETKGEGLREMIILTLKKSFPEATEEQISDFGLEYFEDLVNGILAVNNLAISEEAKKKAMQEMQLPKS